MPPLHLQLVPLAIQTAIEEDVEFRKGLPLGYNSYVGVANSEKVFQYNRNISTISSELQIVVADFVLNILQIAFFATNY